MHAINLPPASARDACDRAFVQARGSGRWPRQSSENLAYRLVSRGAFPKDPARLVARVRAGESVAIDEAIEWLRFDPFCLWSGYLKQRLMRSIASQKLSTRQAAAIRALLLEVLQRGRREEFRDACRLARAVNGEDFRERLRQLTQTQDPDTNQRAIWMLGGCERTAQR